MGNSARPLVSIIIRTKNEERWIASCLRAVYQQTYTNFEVILVDNNSDDLTVKRAQEFNVTIVYINDFLPGRAINDGIKASKGQYLVCLSGHCIPVNEFWLESLVKHLSESDVAGVYGRQEPLSFSSDVDKRDLITVFGLDKKIQIKDSFFHNANSAFRREVWESFPFDEQVTNVEDRVWGKKVISAGMKIIYEPEASAYHWHGIHQDLNPERARSVVKILESIEGLLPREDSQKIEALNIVAIIPLRGKSGIINGKPLLEYAVKSIRGSKYIREIIVSTDETETAELARSLGATVPFIRPNALSEDYVDVLDVLSYSLDQIESEGKAPDLIVILEETYPFRPRNMLDQMIEALIGNGSDVIIAARRETRSVWTEQNGVTSLASEGFMPRKLKRTSAIVGLLGLGCVAYPSALRRGNLFGGKVSFFNSTHPLCEVEVHKDFPTNSIAQMVEEWWRPADS